MNRVWFYIALVLLGGTFGGGLIWAQTNRWEKTPPPGSSEWLAIQNRLAIQAARHAHWQEALYRWVKILQVRPDWAGAWNNLAVALEAMGDWDRALTCYRRALQLEPNNRVYRANYLRFREIRRKYAPKTPSSKTSDLSSPSSDTRP